MSQAGIVDIIGTHPEIPTMFVADVGTAVPIANTLELLGAAVAAHGVPLQTVASGNTVDFNIQYASAAASSVANNAGVASFNSAYFTVDANGFVTPFGGSVVETFTVDAFTAPGTNPVVPNGSGNITVTGGQVAAGTTVNVIRTDSLAANSYKIEIQRSQAVASSTVGDNGVCHFNSAYFTVDANAFVSINGSAIGETITGNSGGALSPTAGNWNILGTGSITTSGSVSTLTVQLTGLTNHAIQIGAGTATLTQLVPGTTGQVLQTNTGADPTWSTATYPSTTTINQILYSSANNTVSEITAVNDGVLISGNTGIPSWLANGTTGQVLTATTGSPPSWTTISTGSVSTLTGNTGGAISPTAGNINTLGTGSITIAGSGSTLTTQLTGLTNHNVLVGAGTATITNVAPSATSGVPLISQGAAADPTFGTAVVAGGGTGATSFTAYAVICGGTTSTGSLQSVASVGTSGQVLTSNGAGALPTFQTYVPTASGFVAYASANLNSVTGDGTFYLVQFNSTSRNNSTMFATGTGLVTVPTSGLWFFNATVDIRLIVSANTDCTLLFEVNGAAQNGNVIVNPFVTVGSSGRLALSTSCFINLSATNTVGVRLQVSGNASKNIRLAGSGTSLLTSFSGSFIGT